MAKNKNEQEVAVTINPLSVPTPRKEQTTGQVEEQVTEQVEKELEPVKTKMLSYTGSGSYTVYEGEQKHKFSGAGKCPLEVGSQMAVRLLKTGLFKEVS